MKFLDKIVACPGCKWIGIKECMGSVPYIRETGVVNPVIENIDVACCPKCNRVHGILTIEYLGVWKFIKCYFEKEIQNG